MIKTLAAAPLFALLALAGVSPAQEGSVQQSIPAAQDVPWPGGTMRLDIDASDTARGIHRVTQTIPLAPGTRRITLLYPEWLPGHHAARGPLAEVADLRFAADGKPVAWTRDPREVHAFHLDLPTGARELTATFVYTSPLEPRQGRVTVTGEMLNLQWEKVSFYPAGHYVGRIRVRPSVLFPAGWTAAAALDGQSRSGNRVTWAETDYETLVDSPIFAGAHFRRWDLGKRVSLAAVADEPRLLEVRPEHVARLSALVDEAFLLFGRPPFDRYEFLVAETERMGGIGLEHLRSSENQLEPGALTKWTEMDWDRNVLAHELAHSWNGKFRRPARLWTPDYRTPMQDDLLWMYEGQTQFWGLVLAARSGLQSKDMVLGMLATQAGKYAEQPGRAWRSLEDTTHDPIIAARKPRPYGSLTRDEDYYNEGALIWLEADQIIRAGSGGRRGLDDFARAFFSHPGGSARTLTYEKPDIIAGLQAVHPHDWAGFLRRRFEEPNQPPPLAGIERSGYRLAWRAEPNPYDKARMGQFRNLNLAHSLGIVVDKEGAITDARWEGAAFAAGAVSGNKIVAVNGIAYDADKLREAIKGARQSGKPIELILRRGDQFRTVRIPYNGGLRWPWLERKAGAPAPLDTLLAPRMPRATR